MTLPHGRQRFYIDTHTCIAVVHELEEIEDRAAPRNDSVVDSILGEHVYRWQTLFGFTAREAGFELLDHRTKRADQIYVSSTKTVSSWPWWRCERLGFDRESYDYWLETVDDIALLDPKDTASWVRHKSGAFELFVMRPVDLCINRSVFAPFVERQPRFHTVYDWKGLEHTAVLLRS